MNMNNATFSKSRPARGTPLRKIPGTVVSKWYHKAIPRWIKRAQPEEWNDSVDDDMWDKNSMWFLDNDNDNIVEEQWDEWDEKAMLDIIVLGPICVDAEYDDEHDTFKGVWFEWNDADVVIDSAEFDEASFYSDTSASWDSDDNMGTGDGAGDWDEDSDSIDPRIDQIYNIYLEL